MFWPCETRTSTCRNLATISSGLYRFLAITVLLDVKDIPQVGPLQWGWIRTTSVGVDQRLVGSAERREKGTSGPRYIPLNIASMANNGLDEKGVGGPSSEGRPLGSGSEAAL